LQVRSWKKQPASQKSVFSLLFLIS
jgi:hypothetical protein